jgi:hypothetical protein
VMLTSSVAFPHAPPGTVQRNKFIPLDKPETPVFAKVAFVKVPVPLTIDQVPPVAGMASSVVVVVQIVWSFPAAAVTPVVFEFMITSSTEGEQGPLEIVQRNVLLPAVKPLTPEFDDVAFAKMPVPEMTVQRPVPIEGAFP